MKLGRQIFLHSWSHARNLTVANLQNSRSREQQPELDHTDWSAESVYQSPTAETKSSTNQ